MSARVPHGEPTFANEAERTVREALRQQLPPGAILLSGLRIVDQTLDHEADLIALIPGAGIVVVEVKGGSVWHGPRERHGDDTPRWWQRGGGVRSIDPVNQALRVKYAVRDYVEGDPRWTRSRVVWGHAVVTPYSVFPPDFALPDCPRWALHDRDDLAVLGERIEDNARLAAQGRVIPSHDDVELISEILRGRGFTGSDRNAEAAERQAAADRLTQEQAMLLQVTRLLPRVEVRGGAGSGKTVLALTQAKELTRGRADRPPQRVALVCYSIGLAEYFKRVVAQWPRRHQPAFVGTYEELGHLWGAPSGTRDNSEFWEVELPARMTVLASGLSPGHRFDSVIVDEAQDFAESWWTPLLRSLKDEEAGGLYVYSDENQRIFARFGQPPVPLVPLVLDHNLRNTRQIYEAFGPMAPTRMTARGGDGVDVHFVPAPPECAVEVADDAVDLLLDVGWFPGNIALLTTGHRHDVQVSETERLGHRVYWRSYWDEEEVFYGHVLGCKGLERPAVVLCLNSGTRPERAREKLYVGMSRATDHLVVVGDPTLIRDYAGDSVADRLCGRP